MITCREIVDFLTDYVQGDLTPEERGRFDEHLAGCPPCVVYVASFHCVITAAKCCCRSEPLPECPDELVRAILASRRSTA